MTSPVPGHPVSTVYGRRGPYWSCDPDAAGNGIHTGVDYAAPPGTPVVAARPGVVAWTNHGAAFGSHQVDVLPGDGTRDFYAHMRTRVPNGAWVEAGDLVGEVGAEGNVTGAHLHFERHATEWGGWSCQVVRDPAPSIAYTPAADQEDDMPTYERARRTRTLTLKPDTWTSIAWDTVYAGEAITEGDTAVYAGGPLVATLTAEVVPEDPGEDTIRTRWLERSGENTTEETWAAVEHPVTRGSTYLTDTRAQRISGGHRFVVQVLIPSGGTLEAAELNALHW